MSVSERAIVAYDTPPADPGPERPASGGEFSLWLVVVALWGAAGMALLSVSFALARNNEDFDAARLLVWVALAAVIAPAIVRLLARSPARSERILIVALTALLLYWTKVLHDPVRLLFPDEFIHLNNTQQIVDSGRLYGENPLLPVSPHYPGLPVVTAGLSKLTGLGVFPCALIVVGLAKVMLSVALFLIFERVSGSARLAGLGALLYCAQANYLFWSSQFSYESLALPLLGVVLLCVVSRNGASRAQRASWTAVGCLVGATVAFTHHVTATALVVILWAQVLLSLRSRRPDVSPPLVIAAVTTAVTSVWVFLVAGGTDTYLGDIFGRLENVIAPATEFQEQPRKAFAADAVTGTATYTGEVATTPLDDRLMAQAAVLVIGVSVCAGVLLARRRRWSDPIVVLLGLGSLAALAVYPLRRFPSAWEIANRTSDFLFLGVGLMAAVAAIALVDRGRRSWRTGAVAIAGFVAIAGGSVLGWPSNARLPRPLSAQVDKARLDAPGPLMADWARTRLPRSSRIIANETNARLLAAAGFAHVSAEGSRGVKELLNFDLIPQWQWDVLRDTRVDYVVLDRRWVAGDNVIGYYYPRANNTRIALRANWLTVRRKYEKLEGSGRLFDGGDIVIYDVRRARRQAVSPLDG